MKKIRINELARELEIKPGAILDLLPELGVQEKKTHSSSVDEDVAIALRHRLLTGGMPEGSRENQHEVSEETAGHKLHTHETAVALEEPPNEQTEAPPSKPVARHIEALPAWEDERTEAKVSSSVAPRGPAVPSPPANGPGAATRPPVPPSIPVVPAAPPTSPETAHSEPGESGKPAKSFQPLRPPLGAGGAIHPPLANRSATPSPGLVNRNLSVPARPAPQGVRPGLETPGPSLGPRQPLPSETARVTIPPPPAARPTPAAPLAPAVSSAGPVLPAPAPPSATPANIAPTAIVLPASPRVGAQPQSPLAAPGTPLPPRPSPMRPQGAGSPGLTPGAPIAPRPQTSRSLAGQPIARPVVPPRQDVLDRLQKSRPVNPLAGSARPGAPPARPAPPTPGQPIYPRGPIRPGPGMRGPGTPPLALPSSFRPRPGPRQMHATSPLRSESPAPPPTEQPRRQHAKPTSRHAGGRTRDEREEGILRPQGGKRQMVAAPPPIDREITIAEGVTVKELSEKLGVKANLVIKKLVEKKTFATINQTLDVKLAEELAREFGASTNQVSYEQESTQEIVEAEDTTDLVRRAPVVTVMGHVDHGKTSLLDAIRNTRVAAREAGGITQHIGAYTVEKNNRKIVFIDTPGHQAFTRMRARGAKVTDLVVLVVAADDGVMPQTIEAIDHAKAAGVPILVAINKIDKPDAQIDRIKQQLSDRGLQAEDWGGDVVMVPVSAKTGQNLDLLLEMVLLVADILDLKANPNRPALGTVLEAQLDKGRGPVATLLVRNGTLRNGDFFICGSNFSKVRAMFDDRGNPIKEAEPSTPVEVIGFEDLADVGDSFQVVTDTAKAKQIVTYRESKARDVAMAKGARTATLDSLTRQFKEGDLKDLTLVIKADVGGTAEVLSDTLQALSTDKVRVRVLRAGVGAITEDDVLLASASEALIVGFNVKVERNAQAVADQQKVDVRLHTIIYDLVDEMKLAMTGLLDPVFKEVILGHAEVKQTFRISKVGVVAGCFVTDGVIKRDSQIRLKRGNEVIHTGKIEALKRFKNDASEVKNGVECGISLVNYNNINEGDILEAFTMERVLPSLGSA